MWEKIGKALGYEDCDIEAFARGIFTRSLNGYCLCADCAEMTDEEVESRLGRSVYDEPMWLETGEYMLWTDKMWETKAKEVQKKNNFYIYVYMSF